ncbi:MAG: hypothetical protein ACI9N9_002933 [Enterobacterales bacterium]|jgi:hypothetical protein
MTTFPTSLTKINGIFMTNFIVEFKNVLSSDYCDHLIDKFESFSVKNEGRTGAGVDKLKKDSLDCYISQHPEWRDECNEIMQSIHTSTVAYARQFPFLLTGAISPSIQDPKTGQVRTINHDDVGQLSNPDIENMINMMFRLDNINLQRYTRNKGGYHHWHSEHYPHPTDPSQKSLHRVLLILLYLNDIEDGGETEFYYQHQKIKPQKGSLILAPVNFTHTHRGCVPISSDKYVLASWVLYNPANQLYGNPKD